MHIEKFNIKQKSQIITHILRDRKDSSYGNQNIDIYFTKDNYSLLKRTDFNEVLASAKEVHQKTTGQKQRSNGVVLCSAVIDLPQEYLAQSQANQQAFFDKAIQSTIENFKINKDMLVYAEVHLDEKTPHVHFGWVPLHTDNKLNAKDQVSKATLKSWHDKVDRDMSDAFKWYKGGIVNSEPTNRMNSKDNISMNEYKKTKEQKQKLELELSEAKKELNKTKKELVEASSNKEVKTFRALKKIEKREAAVLLKENEIITREEKLNSDASRLLALKPQMIKDNMSMIGFLDKTRIDIQKEQDIIFKDTVTKIENRSLLNDKDKNRISEQEVKETFFNQFIGFANKILSKANYLMLHPIQLITDRIRLYAEAKNKAINNFQDKSKKI